MALVTGGTRGIGAAIAAELAEDGWVVALNYRSNKAAADHLTDAISAAGGRAHAVEGDVAIDAVGILQRAAVLGPVLGLVNNAGVTRDNLMVSSDDDGLDAILAVNLTAPFRLTRETLRSMIRQRFGRVVSIASVVGPRANAGQANYAASKAGLIGMTKTAAVEVARRGITVNAVAPGLIDTSMTVDIDERLLASVPARRAGTAQEVAYATRFLMSDRASYVTGVTLFVDGGLST